MIPIALLKKFEKHAQELDYGTVTISMQKKGKLSNPLFIFNFQESIIDDSDRQPFDFDSSVKKKNENHSNISDTA